MRLTHIVPSLEDRHGGPSKSVRALANSLARGGNSVDLLTTADPGETVTAAPTDAVTLRCFPRATPRWLTRSPALARHLNAKTAECFHHHSLWLLTLRYAHEAARAHRVPLVISPRGMMSGWAYHHRRWKKKFSELVVHPGAFAGAAGWHATSAQEADDIRGLGFNQPICVSPNGVNLPTEHDLSVARTSWHQLCPATAQRPVALFYSRFHRKKRVRELIDLWLSVPRSDWLLLVVGVAEEYTAADLTAHVAAARGEDRVAVFDGAGRPHPYAVASLFVLPSHSENFGLVIAEALAARVPTLVTDTTPWEGLAPQHAGWCVPWENFGPTLTSALAEDAPTLAARGARGRTWVDQEFSWTKVAGILSNFYQQLRRG